MPRPPNSKRLSSQSSSLTGAPPPLQRSTNSSNCTTVTMMLANRIAHNSDWSVDDEHFFETNTMNVWQTLEFLSGVNLRKRYHYEGYNDTENIIRTLTPSWRRDSFAEKAAAANKEDANGAGGSGGGSGRGKAPTDNADADFIGNGTAIMRQNQQLSAKNNKNTKKASRTVFVKVRKSGKGERAKCDKQQQRCKKSVTLDPQYALSQAEFTDLVKCK
ncbi:PREDICTED: uncharacterized protein LOC108355872 [Rhagoletis zephyria]|uniref:uncharacterized protein LOC108355872 n=1 Tax=Rhagoletis zephyria TaxID=28612 RepID=UPI000811AAC3|nr:PREDICTED: uncharacterized protein LOC108355872 [Rhagoletis zephyria]